MIRAVLAFATGLFLAGAAAASCRPDVAEIRGDWGSARFTVEIADDAEERAQGLMHREALGTFAGMLFVYPSPRRVGFWMKNTLIPLDMIFLDARGVVLRVHENAEPGSLATIDGGPGVKAVLEINGGMSDRLGIAPGDALRHPAIPQENAAWPCE